MTLRIISLSTSVHMYVRESSDFNLHIIGNVPLKKTQQHWNGQNLHSCVIGLKCTLLARCEIYWLKCVCCSNDWPKWSGLVSRRQSWVFVRANGEPDGISREVTQASPVHLSSDADCGVKEWKQIFTVQFQGEMVWFLLGVGSST